MRAVVSGKVVEVEMQDYVSKDGSKQKNFQAFLAGDNPRYGADRISGVADIAPKVGDVVSYNCIITARSGSRGPWLSVYAISKAQPA